MREMSTTLMTANVIGMVTTAALNFAMKSEEERRMRLMYNADDWALVRLDRERLYIMNDDAE